MVFAAASLQDPFEEIGAEFEAAHEGVGVDFSFTGSSGLVTQIQEGAPADVFASADTANMDKLVDSELSAADRSEEHTSELQSRGHLVCRLLLEKKTIFIRRIDLLLLSLT